MTEWIISSSVLILIVTAMRYILKGKISLRLQYALWGLVMIRLLMPVSFFSSPVSIMNVVPEKTQTEYVDPMPDAYAPGNIPEFDINNMEWIPGTYNPHASVTPVGGADGEKTDVITPWDESPAIKVSDVLTAVWISGIVFTGASLVISNMVFAARLRRSRIPTVKKDGMMIYVTEAVATPCLFGLFRPAIYVTPEVVKNDAVIRHVLEHEMSHKRRGDHIWSVLRGICLAIHWYNPIVWLAAELSRRDGELACDEATIKRIGEDERMDYGRTLIGLTCSKRTAGTFFVAATTMTGSKKSIKERIRLIAKKPHTTVIMLIIVIAAVLLTVGFTFSGAEENDDDPATDDTAYDGTIFDDGDTDDGENDFADGGNNSTAEKEDFVVDTVAIYSNGEYVKPYLQPTWYERWTENGWASATPSLNLTKERIDELGDKIPAVTLDNDFNNLLSAKAWGGFRKTVYDSDFEVVASDIYSLMWLDAGEYYCTFEISVTGDFIESEGRYESEGYLAIFRLIVEKDGASPLTPGDAHDIVSAELRTRMGVYFLNEENDPNGERLDQLMNAFSSAGASGATKCPFYTTSLYLTRADGEVFMTLPAEDSCRVYLSGSSYYSYESDFDGIFNLFGVKTDWEEREYNEDDLLTRISYFSWGQVYGAREYTYDENGYCVEEKYTNGSGEVTERIEYIYDSKGNLAERRLYDYDGKLYRTVAYTYDAAGNLLEQMSYDEKGDKYIRYTYTYENGLCTEMEFFCYADNGQYFEKYGYDNRGNRIKVETYGENGKLSYWHEYEYDSKDCCIKEIRYTASGKLECSWTYEYDFAENIKTTSQYDAKGKFIEKWTNPIEYDPANLKK